MFLICLRATRPRLPLMTPVHPPPRAGAGAGAASVPFASHERQSSPQTVHFEPVQPISAPAQPPPRGSPLVTAGKKSAKSMAHLLQKPGVPKAAASPAALARNAAHQSAMMGGSAMMAEIPTTLSQILDVQHQRQATPKVTYQTALQHRRANPSTLRPDGVVCASCRVYMCVWVWVWGG